MKIIDRPYPHCKWPYVTPELRDKISQQLDLQLSEVDSSGKIGQYEKAIKTLYGVDFALSFSSGTGAMHTILRALNLKKGDKVIAPNYTFFATMSPFSFEGIEVVLIDSNEYGNMSSSSIEEQICKDVKAIIVTHMWGIPCDMDAVLEISKRHELYLIEDCSHAHFAKYKGKRVGTFGDVGVFSTNQKALTTGEGGFILTNNVEIFEKSLLIAHYNKRCRKEIRKNSEYYKFALTGYGLKYRMSPLAAVIGIEQVSRFNEIESMRRYNLKKFRETVSETIFDNISPKYEYEHGLYVFTFLCDENKYNTQAVLSRLHELGGIEFDIPNSTRPLSKEPLFNKGLSSGFRTFGSNNVRDFPKSGSFSKSMIKCPLWGYPEDKNDVEAYLEILRIVSDELSSK